MRRFILMSGLIIIFICEAIIIHKFYISKINQLNKEIYNSELSYLTSIFLNNEYGCLSKINVIDSNGFVSNWIDKVGDGPKLVIYLSSLSCESCIFNVLKIIDQKQNQLKNNDIVFLFGGSSINSTNLFVKKYSISNSAYNLFIDEEIPDFLKQTNKSLFFLVNKNYKIQFLYNFDENSAKVSSLYFNKIQEIILQERNKIDESKNGIFFDKLIFDLGNVKSGNDTSFTIPFVNMMNRPIVINDVISSCGCTIVNWSQKPLNPKEKSFIEIKYSSANLGIFNKYIIVKSNADNPMIKLLLTGKTIK